MNQSESIVELAKALAKAQGEMGGAVKGKSNPFFKSKYADLPAVIEAIKPAFTKNNLCYVQFPISNQVGAGVTTRIMHNSGEWLEGDFIIPCKQDAQGIGSAITYARRYGLQSAAGVPAEDDDGNHAARESDINASDWIAAINESESLEALKDNYTKAYNEAKPNKKAVSAITAAKDAKKKELSE